MSSGIHSWYDETALRADLAVDVDHRLCRFVSAISVAITVFVIVVLEDDATNRPQAIIMLLRLLWNDSASVIRYDEATQQTQKERNASNQLPAFVTVFTCELFF